MKILLFCDTFALSGANIALLSLAQRLQQQHDVCVMPRQGTDTRDSEMQQQLETLGIPIVQDASNIDVVVANTVMAGDCVAQFGDQCPFIWWIQEGQSARDWIWKHPILQQAFQKTSHIVLQTTDQKALLASFLADSPAKVHCLPRWNNTPYTKEQHIEPIPKTKKRIVCIGADLSKKRVEEVVTAVESLSEDLKQHTECVLIGKYDAPEAIKKLIDQHPERYQIKGVLPNKPTLAYLASADVFVSASSDEAQPLTFLESFEYNVPVCAAALPAYTALGLVHGQHVLMHPAGATEILAGNIAFLLMNDFIRQKLTKQAKGFLFRLLVRDWTEEFEHILEDAVMHWKIKQLEY